VKKHILKENYDRLFGKREFGDPLPTFKGVMGKHQNIQEARFRGANGQGINAKVTKAPKDDESRGWTEGQPVVSYSPKDWGAFLTRDLLEAIVEKIGEDFTLSVSAGMELGKGEVPIIKGTRHGLWKHNGINVTIAYWASFR
jgi:hypothetical protein